MLLRTSRLNRSHTFLTHIWMLSHKLKYSILQLGWCLQWYKFISPSTSLTYRSGSRMYDKSLTEKYIIARANHKNLLNKRPQLFVYFHIHITNKGINNHFKQDDLWRMQIGIQAKTYISIIKAKNYQNLSTIKHI